MSSARSPESPYAKMPPSAQQTLDLFSGRWASALPEELGLRAGTAALFADPRVAWAESNLLKLGSGIRGKAILELGPLEGGHTYLLSKAGAASVTAIEAHPEAYLKCLVAKEILGVERVNFLYGDACAFLRQNPHFYDLTFACGLLYHMVNPLELLDLISQRSRAIFLWTVFWDQAFANRHPAIQAGSDGTSEISYAGQTYRLHRHNYGNAIDYKTFWGGAANYANWMERDGILDALRRFGFVNQIYEIEHNPNGSALKLVATKDQ